MKRTVNFEYKAATTTIYKDNVIYYNNGYFTAFITNNFYRSLSDCKKAITICIKNGWVLRPMSEVTQIIHQAVTNIIEVM